MYKAGVIVKRSYIAFGAATLTVLALGITAAVVLGGKGGQSSVPDFVMPQDSSAFSTAEPPTATTDDTPAETSDVITASSAFTTTSGAIESTASDKETTTASQNASSGQQGSNTPVETSSAATSAQTSTAGSSGVTSVSSHTAAAETSSSGSGTSSVQPEEVPDNILVTSGDPLHHIVFEFRSDSVEFSGVYSGATVTELRLYRPLIYSRDLTVSGSSFSGSLNISGLEQGYYIIMVRLDSGAVMYYVFLMTDEGAVPVPEDALPSASNLAFAGAPMELASEGVLHQITVSDDRETAKDILSEIKDLSDQICAGITDDYQKARVLCEWVSHNLYYDKDAAANGVTEEEITLEFVLKNHRSVCFGWSNLYAALCQAQGITCYNASGSVVTGSRCFPQTEISDERSHSWNLVKIGDRLIWVDTVWNSSNTYDRGNYFKSSYDMEYFDINNTVLSCDHRVARLEHRDYFGI